MQPIHNIVSEPIRMQSVELLNMHLAAAIDPQAQVTPARRNVDSRGCIAIYALFDTAAASVDACSARAAARAAARAFVLGRTARGTVPVASAGACAVRYPPGVAPPGIADERQRVFAASAIPTAFGQSVRAIRSACVRVGR